MIDLKALVIEKRLSCSDDCSYQVRKKRYREQRQNLGELNRLASTRPRPVLKVEEVVPILRTGHSTKIKEEDELSSSGESSQADEWFELSKKRMFEGDDINYIKRLQTANREELERERQANYDNWEAFHKQFMKDWREDRERAEKQESRKSIRASLKEFEEMKRRANKRDAENVIRSSLKEFQQMKGGGNRRDAEDIIRASLKEYEEMKAYERDDIGTLEELR